MSYHHSRFRKIIESIVKEDCNGQPWFCTLEVVLVTLDWLGVVGLIHNSFSWIQKREDKF